MLLNKETKCNCGGNCSCKTVNENSVDSEKELLGSFNQKIPVLETNNHEYRVIKETKKTENLLLS
jgi:hypothetical protein